MTGVNIFLIFDSCWAAWGQNSRRGVYVICQTRTSGESWSNGILHFYFHSFLLCFVATLHGAVGSLSDCRSKGRKLKSQLGHVTFAEIDHEIISTVILHFPLIHWFKKWSCQLLANVFEQYWLTTYRTKASQTKVKVQYNLSGSNPDGLFTVDNSNLFFSPYKILPIAQENKYLGIFFLILSWNCMLFVLIRIASSRQF